MDEKAIMESQEERAEPLPPQNEVPVPPEAPAPRSKLALKSPFWAGVLLGLGSFLFSGMLGALPLFYGLATGSRLLVWLGYLVAAGVGVFFIITLNNSRRKNGLPGVTWPGLALGLALYLLIGTVCVTALYQP
jgi:hypothetical protein